MKHRFFSILAASTMILFGSIHTQAEEIIVKKGDTLWDLSQQYNISVDSIKKWNNLSGDLIYPNDVLEVSPIKNLMIRKGDTLWDISKVYEVSVTDLMKWNQLSSDLIHPGSQLVIYTNNSQKDPQPVQESSELTTETQSVEEIITETAPKEPTESSPVEPAASAEPVETAPVEPVAPSEPVGTEMTVEATAYTAECEGCSGITKTGVDLKANPDQKVIAVDPSVIPLGSKVYVEGYGYATAEDIGGGIKGNEIDVFVPDHEDALEWGRKEVKVTIID